MINNDLMIYDEENLKSKIYIVRGVQVMLDFDLAAIYVYETKRFNEQVKNNIERFDDDFRFQLTEWEFKNMMSKFSTSSWGGTRKRPFAFTELGVYSLMTVLKGDLAVTQSKKLLRLFKKLKDYAIQIQNVLPSSEIQILSIQTQNNTEDIRQIKQQITEGF